MAIDFGDLPNLKMGAVPFSTLLVYQRVSDIAGKDVLLIIDLTVQCFNLKNRIH